MRRKFTFIFLFILTLVLTGCKFSQDPLILKAEEITQDNSSSEFKFKVENINLTSGYQNLKPNVTISKDDRNNQILVSCGLMESSGIEIENIERLDDDINIYIKNISDDSLNKFVVPQALVSLDSFERSELEYLNFNIVNTNYDNITLNININDILNKIQTTYKVITSTYPSIELEKNKDDGKLIWNIEYTRVFHDEFETSPIVDLKVKVDAETGHLSHVESKKISTYIDHGLVLDKKNPEYIVYKNSDKLADNTKDTLFIYNIRKQDKEELHIGSLPITSAKLSPNAKYIALLEKDENNNIIYIIERNSKKSYKVMLNNENNKISDMAWDDDNNLLIVENLNKKSIIHKYNIKRNEFIEDINLNFQVNSICFNSDNYVTTYTNTKANENTINILDNNFNDLLDIQGYKPTFLNSNKLGYLNLNLESNNNEFFILNLDDNSLYDKIELNITNFIPIDDDNLILISNNGTSTEYNIYIYNISSKVLEEKNKTLTDNIWYNKKNKLVYSNYRVPENTSTLDSNIIFYLNDFNLFN